jgi:hypothetical protein
MTLGVDASSLEVLLTCAYVAFFVVSLCIRNKSAIFEPCERDLYVGKVAQRGANNRTAINCEVVLLNKEW